MIVNANSIGQPVIHIKNGIKKCQCECKNYRTCKKDYSWNPSTCICEIGKYLESNVDDSKIACEKIMQNIGQNKNVFTH